jgi:hypothetical protein
MKPKTVVRLILPVGAMYVAPACAAIFVPADHGSSYEVMLSPSEPTSNEDEGERGEFPSDLLLSARSEAYGGSSTTSMTVVTMSERLVQVDRVTGP